ncbi:hypothetical protein BAGQ_2606 [Bacillus velezensis]|nr:hypothetical protein [Bacillus amyloliquefaciens]ANF37390.1 hypothetical protein BCBMB205_24960 [Bacillus velezensis]ARZ58838.1 hypothetical protein BAGQ_2606 [Bacillus velezensis]
MMHITRFPLVFVQTRVPAVSHQTANADKSNTLIGQLILIEGDRFVLYTI